MKRSVKINMDLLVKEMYKKGVTPKILQKQLSVSDSWWSVFNCTERTSGRTEALICKVLGKEPGYFEKNERLPDGEDKNVSGNCADIREALRSIQSELEEIRATQDKIYSKVQENTIQLEKLKDMWK